MDSETKEMLQILINGQAQINIRLDNMQQELSEVKQLATNINQRLIKVEAVQDYELKWLDKLDQRLQIQELA